MAKPLILIVDDEAYIAELLAELLLDEFECEIEVAHDGVQALALARRLRPALVITDLMMPRLDGWGFVRALRGHANLADVPVIVMSAAPQRPAWTLEQRLRYIPKPFEPDMLFDTVAALL